MKNLSIKKVNIDQKDPPAKDLDKSDVEIMRQIKFNITFVALKCFVICDIRVCDAKLCCIGSKILVYRHVLDQFHLPLLIPTLCKHHLVKK